MRLNNKYFLWPLLFVLFTLCLEAQYNEEDSIACHRLNDTSMIETRVTPPGIMEEYRNDKDFQYYKKVEESSPFSEFLQYLINKIIENLIIDPIQNPGNPVNIIIIICFIAGMAFLVIRFTSGSLFGRNVKIAATVSPLNLREIEAEDLEARLNNALEKQQYRDSVRYLYLITLRKLRNREIILWKPDKTNAAFANDIKDQGLKNKFLHVSAMFEYVWYGDFRIDASVYGAIEQRFSDFSTYLGKYNER